MTERVVRALKHEWLRRVPLIRGLDHVGQLLVDFACYCSVWRAHMALDGAVPDLSHAGQHRQQPPRTAKAIPARIERCFVRETRITAFRLAA